MASNGFSLDISKWAEQTKSDIALTVRKTALDMFGRIVLRTPVGNPDLWQHPRKGYVGGRLRNNWYCTVGQPSAETNDTPDKNGANSMASIASGVERYTLGDTIWLSNSLAYAWPVERGHSKQSPAGMVGITVTEFQSLFDRAAKSTKSFA